MLQSYEAIYDHGRLTWTGEAPKLVRGRVMVTLVNDLAEGQLIENDSRVPVSGFSGPLASLRARVATQYGDLQPMRRDELYDRSCLR